MPDVTVANYSAVKSLGQWNELRDSKDFGEFHTLLQFNYRLWRQYNYLQIVW